MHQVPKKKTKKKNYQSFCVQESLHLYLDDRLIFSQLGEIALESQMKALYLPRLKGEHLAKVYFFFFFLLFYLYHIKNVEMSIKYSFIPSKHFILVRVYSISQEKQREITAGLDSPNLCG